MKPTTLLSVCLAASLPLASASPIAAKNSPSKTESTPTTLTTTSIPVLLLHSHLEARGEPPTTSRPGHRSATR
ncbi:uncharacterized protein BDZ99DRAFT_465128 [Mytilinidion resinicola]|uniref:Uncharacterized protein n=1 Tax=Mytilinidion resinicola TaxID=574789 RepID=A0A6A6YGR7_9PEZI|nr:uncharacterized protein BDZ99DRAFT_465128 [Mytilinidion resinicola]KAF2807204.1 hypothetical protein BDZ99DRAFT_465128 [Mytilinidion resinicola]